MDKDAMITYLIGELKKENLELHDLIIPEELEEKQKLLRALFNTPTMAPSTILYSALPFNFFHPFRFFPLKRGSQFCAPKEAAQNKSKVNTIFFFIIID